MQVVPESSYFSRTCVTLALESIMQHEFRMLVVVPSSSNKQNINECREVGK